MRKPPQASPATTVYLVFARSGPGDGEDVVEPLVAVVTDESEAAGLERSVVALSYNNEFVQAIGAGDRVVGVDRGTVQRAPYLGAEPVALWHGDHDLRAVDAVVLPGGFSYGDYLRAGAIARFAPVMTEVVDAASTVPAAPE